MTISILSACAESCYKALTWRGQVRPRTQRRDELWGSHPKGQMLIVFVSWESLILTTQTSWCFLLSIKLLLSRLFLSWQVAGTLNNGGFCQSIASVEWGQRKGSQVLSCMRGKGCGILVFRTLEVRVSLVPVSQVSLSSFLFLVYGAEMMHPELLSELNLVSRSVPHSTCSCDLFVFAKLVL